LTDLLGLHKVAHFVQIDMDVRALDFPRGVTPLTGEELPIKTGLVLGTGDSFITNAEKQLEGLGVEIDLVDMEGYALNKVCQHHGVAFEAYKYISDSADETAGDDWKNSVKQGTHLFIRLLEKEFKQSQLL
jgi:adenosylhomocysteine nucleosidase